MRSKEGEKDRKRLQKEITEKRKKKNTSFVRQLFSHIVVLFYIVPTQFPIGISGYTVTRSSH